MNCEVSDYSYCKTITVSIPCDRKSGFVIQGDNAAKIKKHLSENGKMEFSKIDGKCSVSVTFEADGDNVKGSISIDGGECDQKVKAYLQDTPLCVNFYDLIVKFTLQCPYSEENNNNKTWLCLDLGNTRTCALLDLPDEEVAFYYVNFNAHNENYKGILKNDDGVVDSFCAVVENDESCKRNSFVVFGKEALKSRQSAAKKISGRKVAFSSPKRFFWDEQRDNTIAKIPRVGEFAEFDSDSLNYFEKELLEGERYYSPKHVFQSSIVELLEQADDTLQKFKLQKDKLSAAQHGGQPLDDMQIRKITKSLENVAGVTDLVFTYPAAWTLHERNEYKKTIEAACAIYERKRSCGCCKLNVHMSCDEATAVLMYHIKSEVERRDNNNGINPMLSWVYENGKIANDKEKQMVCRLGVIDVGGGTSDLTIAEIKSKKEDHVTKLDVESLYSNGTHDAGDKLLLSVIQKILLESVALSFLKKDFLNELVKGKKDAIGKKEEYLTFFYECLKDDAMKKLTRSFWFTLAINAVTAIENGKGEIEIPDGESDLLREGCNDITKHLNARSVKEKMSDFSDKISVIKLPPNCKELYQEAIRETFSATAALMCSALLVHDCDKVFFGGKTMEQKSVRNFFEDYLPIPSDYLEKSKHATAIGAEYYFRRNEAAMEFGIELDDNFASPQDEKFYWYIMPNDSCREDEVNCSSENRTLSFSMMGSEEIIIYRKKFKNNSAQEFKVPSYKLESKTKEFGNADIFNVKIVKIGNELKLSSVKRGSEDLTGKWSLSVCMLDEREQSWLDSGNIVPKN